MRPSGVEFLEARQLHLVKAAAPRVSSEHRLAMDRVWDDAVQANPAGLFDGAVVACAGVGGPREFGPVVDAGDLPALRPHVDYLEPVARRYADALLRRDA